MHLLQYLENKPLFYDKIDTLRMPRVYGRIKCHLQTPKRVIQIVGTNGKGSTGGFLAQMLRPYGDVAHYTSPHILHLNERFALNGKAVSDDALDLAHQRLQQLLQRDESAALSYFEYTTLLAAVLFESVDFLILEAGLGGIEDATSSLAHDLLLCTAIDFDHQQFLGDTLRSIVTHKVAAVQQRVILGAQHHQEVIVVANEVADAKRCELLRYEQIITTDHPLHDMSLLQRFPAYQKENFLLAASALMWLGYALKTDVTYEAPFGRLTPFRENVWLDVGHNMLSAQAIRDQFDEKSIILVYNSLEDKPYQQILAYLKPIIARVEFIAIENSRAVSYNNLTATLKTLHIAFGEFHGLCNTENYLVFGSFSVVEAFLKRVHG